MMKDNMDIEKIDRYLMLLRYFGIVVIISSFLLTCYYYLKVDFDYMMKKSEAHLIFGFVYFNGFKGYIKKWQKDFGENDYFSSQMEKTKKLFNVFAILYPLILVTVIIVNDFFR